MLPTVLRKWLAPKSVSPASRQARGLRMEYLEDRTVPATFTVNPGQSIQAALNAAAAASGSDTVVVNAGTYTEALTITDANNVTLKASGLVTINAPANMTPVTLSSVNLGAAVIDIYSKKATVDGLRINGATNTDGDLYAGIRVIQGGSATIKNNTVTGLLNGADITGNIGIQVGTSNVTGTAGAGTAKVTNNVVSNYKGAGVLVDGAGGSAQVKSNTITGRGLANGDVQYGVQVSRGATARVESNTISGNSFTTEFTASAGIFFYQAGGRASVAAKNNIFGNDDGILVQESNGTCNGAIEIVNNDVHHNTGFAAIHVLLSNNVEVENNDVFCNTTSNGIALGESSGVEVEGNDVRSNPYADGIYVFGGANNVINCNDSRDNGYNGVFLEDSVNNLVYNNLTSGNDENGIKVLGGSGNDLWLGASTCNILDGILLQDTTGTTVVGNALLANGGYGLRLVNADNTFVAFNLITCNDAGSVFIDSASTGTVMIGNRTDTPPVREGSTGSGGNSWHYSHSHSHADDDSAGLDD